MGEIVSLVQKKPLPDCASWSKDSKVKTGSKRETG